MLAEYRRTIERLKLSKNRRTAAVRVFVMKRNERLQKRAGSMVRRALFGREVTGLVDGR